MVEREILGKLNLGEDQKLKLRALLKETQQSIKAAREQAKETLDKSVMKSKREEILKTYHEGLAGILSADQMTQYQQLHKEYREKMKAEKGKKIG